jgi:hypothetical protein
MNANVNRLIGFSSILLAIGSNAFAQTNPSPAKTSAPNCFKQGYSLCDDKLPAAYSASARIDVRSSWDFFLTGSFIYWHAEQEGMDIAYSEVPATGIPLNDKAQIQKFEFKPGFKVGLGLDLDYDNWIGSVEYTWFHQQTHMSKDAPVGKRWQITNWLTTNIVATSFSSKWRSNFDILDASLSRPYYRGRKITVTPFGGVRAAWIRQNLHVDAIYTPDSALPWISYNRSHSWNVGPRAGLLAHWLLGAGFRMEGDLSGSLLFTRFTKVSHDEVNPDGESQYSLHYRDYNTFRPMTDMSIGLGWGSYFDHHNFHFDLLATYDFSVLWGQNMMRSLVNSYNTGETFEAASLHLQGLTVTTRFDF